MGWSLDDHPLICCCSTNHTLFYHGMNQLLMKKIYGKMTIRELPKTTIQDMLILEILYSNVNIVEPLCGNKREKKHKKTSNPKFHLCCGEGCNILFFGALVKCAKECALRCFSVNLAWLWMFIRGLVLSVEMHARGVPRVRV